MVTKPVELTLGEVFYNDQYIIPLYQRNYAWGEEEINLLIQDVYDYASDGSHSNYYIGSLVVHKRNLNDGVNFVFETIDGQQRLTTLNILLSVIKNEFDVVRPENHSERLRFDSRQQSSETLRSLYHKQFNDNTAKNSSMLEAYSIICKKLNSFNHEEVRSFIDFLLNKVILLRVEVPHDTDLNHYFEIMNNRGEQLEKHELLKSTFLTYLKDDKDSSLTFSLIWDACSNMEKYAQLNFKKKFRDAIFLNQDQSNWDYLPCTFEEINTCIISIEKDSSQENIAVTNVNFLQLLTQEQNNQILENDAEDDIESVRFNSVIGFPNFLLHALRVFSQEDIPLDDKRLLKVFESFISRQNDKSNFVKQFSIAMLTCRLLFDKYVLKREFKSNVDSWSLQGLKFSKTKKKQIKPYYTKSLDTEIINKKILMIQSMFHVSFPQAIYKHWLSAVMNFLYSRHTLKIDEHELTIFLEKLSNAFLFDRFGLYEISYYDIIYKNKLELVNRELDLKCLHLGVNVQNFIFNRLDYLIWHSIVINNTSQFKIHNIESFEFGFRSSVEHYYPQNPKPGSIQNPVGPEFLNRFGNLCLISRSKNSELSNYSPLAKAEHYEQSTKIESLKQRLMMQKRENWDELSISDHEHEMINLLISRT